MKTKQINGVDISYITKKIFFLFSVYYVEIISGKKLLVVYFTSFKEAIKLKDTIYKESFAKYIYNKQETFEEHELENLIIYSNAEEFAKKYLTVIEYEKVISKKISLKN